MPPTPKSPRAKAPASGARSVCIGLVQGAMDADPATNVKRYLALADEAARKGAQVIVLPELFRSPYFCQSEDDAFFALAEPIPGPTSQAFAALATSVPALAGLTHGDLGLTGRVLETAGAAR